MEKTVLDYVINQTKELIETPTVCTELKEVANEWLESVGTNNEREITIKYIQELEEDIMPIDQLIAFASSDAGKDYFGEELAGNIVAHSTEMKAKGDKYCDCPACFICGNILARKEDMLK